MNCSSSEDNSRCVDSPTRQFFSKACEKDERGSKNECLTLADIKRRARREAEEARNENYIKRFQMLNFTSEDNRQRAEVDLRSYYCCICGHHSFVVEGDITKLPLWNDYYVIPMANIFSKLYLEPHEQILVHQKDGLEWRVIHRCTQCHFQLAYRIRTGVADDLLTEYTYIAKDSVVARQTDAAAMVLDIEFTFETFLKQFISHIFEENPSSLILADGSYMKSNKRKLRI